MKLCSRQTFLLLGLFVDPHSFFGGKESYKQGTSLQPVTILITMEFGLLEILLRLFLQVSRDGLLYDVWCFLVLALLKVLLFCSRVFEFLRV